MNQENRYFEQEESQADGHENVTQNDRNLSIKQWIYHIHDTYGCSVFVLLSYVYSNMGLRVLLDLTVRDYFK